MNTSCSSSRTIEFLGFDGCPNTPALRERLAEANPTLSIVDIDLMSLNTGDSRLGWGAPTILVDGEDLFGLAPSSDRAVSCRNWSNGLPEVAVIRKALAELEQ